MALVVAIWVLAMVSGLSWARVWTVFISAVAIVVFLFVQPNGFACFLDWTWWVQAVMIVLTPVLIDQQRSRYRDRLSVYQSSEAEKMAALTETARALLSLERDNQNTETAISETADVYHVTKETSRALHTQELFKVLLDVVPNFIHTKRISLIHNLDTQPAVFSAEEQEDGSLRIDSSVEFTTLQRVLWDKALSGAKGGFVNSDELDVKLPDGVNSSAWMPLIHEKMAVGLILVDDISDKYLDALILIAKQISLQLARISLYQKVEALAITDSLTGLSVRSHFIGLANDELERAKRYQLAFSVLMVDLDHFKKQNDTYGHLVGDVVLRDVAKLLKQNLREIDLIARFGGEEFVILLVETGREQASVVAQRLKQMVEVHPIRAYDELLTQTVSIGLSTFPENGELSIEDLIHKADQALYAAKRGGRNRVVCSE